MNIYNLLYSNLYIFIGLFLIFLKIREQRGLMTINFNYFFAFLVFILHYDIFFDLHSVFIGFSIQILLILFAYLI